jgi:hypothetical protein
MKLAIMQPYFFPYIGYYQLVNAVDKFVLYDDVNFISRGWIHRNKFLIGGEARLVSIPLKSASQNKLICDLEVDDVQPWREKFLHTIELAYKKAPQFTAVFPLVSRVVTSSETRIASLAAMSIRVVAEFLRFHTEFVATSRVYENATLKAEQRILDICRREQTTDYINPRGGRELYCADRFAERDMCLHFLETHPIQYAQFNGRFTPCLSMLDVLMFNDKTKTSRLLEEYTLHSP